MKKLKVLFAVLFIITIFIIPTNAVEVNSASNKFLFDNYAVSNNNVSGDLLTFGNSVLIKGNVVGDVVSAGQTVSIQTGDTTSNIYAAGNMVSISSSKARNVYAIGASVTVDSGTSLNGAYLAGKDIFFNGSAKDLYATGTSVTIDGNVTENLVIRSDNINIRDTSKIDGNIEIYANQEPQLPATINKQKVRFHKIETKEQDKNDKVSGMIIFKILGLLTSVLIAIIFILLDSKYFLIRAREFKEKLGRYILYGFITFIVIPIASIIAMIPIVTIPISIIVLMLYGITLFVAPVYTGVVLGRLFLKNANRYLAAMAGAAAVGLVLMIPYIGALGYLVCVLYTLGSIVSNIKIGKKETEKTNETTEKNETLNLEEKIDTPPSE